MIKNEYKVFGRVDFDFEKFFSNLNTDVLGRKILFLNLLPQQMILQGNMPKMENGDFVY